MGPISDPFVLYPATDGQQTGNNFVAVMLTATGNMLPGNMLPWCKRGLILAFSRTHLPLP